MEDGKREGRQLSQKQQKNIVYLCVTFQKLWLIKLKMKINGKKWPNNYCTDQLIAIIPLFILLSSAWTLQLCVILQFDVCAYASFFFIVELNIIFFLFTEFYLMIIFFFFFAFWSTPPIRVFRSYQNKLHSFLVKFHINYWLIQSIPSLLWCELVQHVDIHGRMHGLQLHVVYGYLLGPFKSSGQLLFMSVCAYV